jgi:hypothetical protein
MAEDILQQKRHDYKDYDFSLMVARPRMGKTTLLKYTIIPEYLKNYGIAYAPDGIKPRVLIHDPGDAFAKWYPSVEDLVQKHCHIEGKGRDKVFVFKHGKQRHEFQNVAEFMAIKDETSPNGYLWREGVLRMAAKSKKESQQMEKVILDHLKHLLLIRDDFTNYMVNGKPTILQSQFPVNRGNLHMECIFIFHALKKIPREWGDSAYVTKMILFDTGENDFTDAQWKYRFARWQEVKAALKKVRRKVRTPERVQPYEFLDFSY